MPLPNTLGAYTGEFEALERALADPKGIRIWLGPSRQKARHFRYRLHYARSLDRVRSCQATKPGDPTYNTSAFDVLICRLREDTTGDWWVYIEKNEAIPGYVESLSGEATP